MTDAIMGEMVEELMVFARQGVGSGKVEVNLRLVIADTVDQRKGTFDRPGIADGGSGRPGTSESSQREAWATGRIDPEARVAIITGYLSRQDLIEGAAAIVHKPYKVQNLISAIHEAVSG